MPIFDRYVRAFGGDLYASDDKRLTLLVRDQKLAHVYCCEKMRLGNTFFLVDREAGVARQLGTTSHGVWGWMAVVLPIPAAAAGCAPVCRWSCDLWRNS